MAQPRSNDAPGSGRTPPPDTKPGAPPAPKENVKETIESILVAFILAFVFRAFVVEAFVIPSGSMATTLLGAHMRFRCEQCGYQFDVNYPGNSSEDTITIPSMAGAGTAFSAHCPNCGFKVRRDEGLPAAQNAANPPVHYGDRILVLKYLYLLQDARRWDVVVFKSPSATDYQANFIKRLVGRPGETIMILDGDIYACPNAAADKARKEHPDDWVGYAPWEIQTKPKKVQDALWRVVYDNDFYPQKIDGVEQNWQMPWKQSAGSGWTTGGLGHTQRVVTFNNPDGQGALAFDRDANPGTYPFSDWLPYNETKPLRSAASSTYNFDAYGSGRVMRWFVSDVKVQFIYDRQSGSGPLRAALTKLHDTFVAELTPGTARLIYRAPDGNQVEVGQVKLQRDGPIQVELQNVDYRVVLRLNGKDAIATSPAQYRPPLRRLLAMHQERERLFAEHAPSEDIRKAFPPPSVELEAERQVCSISHLSLWRDVYYTPKYDEVPRWSGSLIHGSPENPIRLARAGESQGANRPPTENEYFVLGDNSILSADARSWSRDVDLIADEDLFVRSGRVPERFMLGKAFFVYWPAGYRPFTVQAPGLVPNFGEMRFIH